MKNFKIDIDKRGLEVLVVRISAQKEDGTFVTKKIDLGGNATTAAFWGARSVIEALREMEKE